MAGPYRVETRSIRTAGDAASRSHCFIADPRTRVRLPRSVKAISISMRSWIARIRSPSQHRVESEPTGFGMRTLSLRHRVLRLPLSPTSLGHECCTTGGNGSIRLRARQTGPRADRVHADYGTRNATAKAAAPPCGSNGCAISRGAPGRIVARGFVSRRTALARSSPITRRPGVFPMFARLIGREPSDGRAALLAATIGSRPRRRAH